jgi:pantoate--beta-alanine ligase
MKVIDEPAALRAVLDEARTLGQHVGFVPTMGALHGGHRSLVRRAAAECNRVVVSLFVNPLQFGPGEDYESYPRDLAGDCAQAEEAGAHLVFAPSTRAMYPEEPLTTVSVRRLSHVLEGRSRPGHFDGVATVITKFFAIVGPCLAYFGEKDYQQLLIVSRLAQDLCLPVIVVPCPTIRESDGLALSSRNVYLSPEDRQAAPVFHWSLLAGKRAIEEKGVTDPARVRAVMQDVVGREGRARLDYAEVARPGDLSIPETITEEVRLLIAGYVGRTRLIDNVVATPPDREGTP